MLKIIVTPSPILLKKSEPVLKFDKKLKEVIAEMSEALDATVDPKGVGLAAPQVGVSKRIFLAKPDEKKRGLVFVNPEIIDLKNLLNILGINHKQLICLGILVGTDYNPGGVKGVGPKNAIKIVKEHKEPEKIFGFIEKSEKYVLDFKWKEIFDLFMNPDVKKSYEIKFKSMDKDKIKKLLVEKHEFNEERINSALEKLSKSIESVKQKNLDRWF